MSEASPNSKWSTISSNNISLSLHVYQSMSFHQNIIIRISHITTSCRIIYNDPAKYHIASYFPFHHIISMTPGESQSHLIISLDMKTCDISWRHLRRDNDIEMRSKKKFHIIRDAIKHFKTCLVIMYHFMSDSRNHCFRSNFHIIVANSSRINCILQCSSLN